MTASNSIIIQAPAKINLFLKVLGGRPDGYHEVYSLIQAVSLYDTLEITPISSGIELICESDDIPSDETNLVWQAARLIQQETGFSAGVRIRLEKRIPVGAGLGGGSSDAAATLKALNRLYDLQLPVERLSEIGAILGSDIPFFLSSGQALVSGRGEVVRSVTLPMDYNIVLVVPAFSVSTAWAYRHLRISLTSDKITPNFIEGTKGQELYKSLSDIGNDFSNIVRSLDDDVGGCMGVLWQAGAEHVEVSGSGSAFYGLFHGEPDVDLSTLLKDRIGWRAFNLSPVCL